MIYAGLNALMLTPGSSVLCSLIACRSASRQIACAEWSGKVSSSSGCVSRNGACASFRIKLRRGRGYEDQVVCMQRLLSGWRAG